MALQPNPSDSGHRAPGTTSLAGIRVIELADEQAEYCGLTLAGLGAEVIKIEPPGGNPTRRIGPFYQDKEDIEGVTILLAVQPWQTLDCARLDAGEGS